MLNGTALPCFSNLLHNKDQSIKSNRKWIQVKLGRWNAEGGVHFVIRCHGEVKQTEAVWLMMTYSTSLSHELNMKTG